MFMLRGLRKNKGMTMKELGDIIGVAESTISQYETQKREPDFETLLKFGEIFDVSVDYLLRGKVFSGEIEKTHNTRVEGLTPDESRLLELAMSLSPENRAKLLERGETLYEIEREQSQ